MTSIAPLIFFVHVPKTAGSTVNSYLREHMPNGHSQCHAFFYDDEELRRISNTCDWLSGHIDFATAESRLQNATERPVRYFSCMRSPTKHVMSHYNWLIEIFYRGKSFYEAHPPIIKEISEIIRGSGSDADSITKNLDRFAGLLLNVQSRIILGHSFNWSDDLVSLRLGGYEKISNSASLDDLLSKIIGAPTRAQRTENVSRYHFDPDIFETEQIQQFLRTRNNLDEILYSTVRTTSP